MTKVFFTLALLLPAAGCIVPAAGQAPSETTEFTIDEEGDVVEIPTDVDRAWKWEIR